MSAPRKHPIDRTLELAEETAEIMWRIYHAHLGARRNIRWQEEAQELYARCVECDNVVLHLKHLREKAFRVRMGDAN